MDMISAPFKKQDEFAIFHQALLKLHEKDPAYVTNVIAQLSENDKKFLKEHIETKRIRIQHKGVDTQVARRIIKVKRSAGGGFGAV